MPEVEDPEGEVRPVMVALAWAALRGSLENSPDLLYSRFTLVSVPAAGFASAFFGFDGPFAILLISTNSQFW